MISKVWMENLKGREYSEDLDVDGRILLLFELCLGDTGFKDVEWIHVDQDKDRWGNFVNTAMDVQIL